MAVVVVLLQKNKVLPVVMAVAVAVAVAVVVLMVYLRRMYGCGWPIIKDW